MFIKQDKKYEPSEEMKKKIREGRKKWDDMQKQRRRSGQTFYAVDRGE